jgi:hypothetical protein
MANWIVSRCDNPSETYVVDLIDLSVKQGQIISFSIEGRLVCGTLVEQTEDRAKYVVDSTYESCLECLNKINVPLRFLTCFGEGNIIIPSSVINFVPKLSQVYNLDLTVVIGLDFRIENGETINIKDCYVYNGYTEEAPVGDFTFNEVPNEYDSCEKCNPYKSEISKWSENVSKLVGKAKESYSNLFPA